MRKSPSSKSSTSGPRPARQFRGMDGYAGFKRWHMYEPRFTCEADGQVRIAAGHEPGQPELLVPAKRFEEWWVGDFRAEVGG